MIDPERYTRQVMLPQIGGEGQRRIESASVLIVGLGGLGAPVSVYLTGAGVGRIGLCDSDVVSVSNLQRQVLYQEDEIGLPKTEVARRRLSRQSPHTVFDLYPEGLVEATAESVIASFDLVVDCCDNYATRYLIDDVCSRLGKPWVYGSIGAFHGQVALMNGRNGGRYSMLYSDREALTSIPPKVAGVLGPVPGVIGALEASEALKWIAGIESPLDGRLFSIDLLTLSVHTIDFM